MRRKLQGQHANNSLGRQNDHYDSYRLNGNSNAVIEDGNEADLYSLQMDMPIKGELFDYWVPFYWRYILLLESAFILERCLPDH